MKIRNRLHRILASLLLFSFLLNCILSFLNTDTIYADSKVVYVFIVDSYDYVGKLGVTDKSKAEIHFICSSSFNPGSSFQEVANKVGKAKNSAIVCLPKYSGSASAMTDDLAKSTGENKANFYIKNILGSSTNMDKAKVKIAYTFATNNRNIGIEASMNKDITKINNYYKKVVKKSFTVKNNPLKLDIKIDEGFNTLVKKLQADKSYGTTFKYLATGSNMDTSTSTSTSNTSDSNTTETQGFANTEELLKSIGIKSDEETQKRIEKYATYILGLGYSQASTAGILANMGTESSFNPLSASTWNGDVNGGLFGFTPLSKFTNSQENKDCKCAEGKKDAKGQSICASGDCQVLYCFNKLKSLIDSNADDVSKANEFFTEHKASEFKFASVAEKSWGPSRSVKWPEKLETIKNLDEFKQLQDPVSASADFMICYERAAAISVPCGLRSIEDGDEFTDAGDKTFMDCTLHEFDINSKESRLSRANAIYTWLTGSSFSSNNSVNDAAKMAEDAYKKGYLTEEELSAWSKIINENFIGYKDVLREDLSQNDLSSLSTWETNVRYDELENHGIFNFFRKLFVGIGILMLLYSGILYCCYWLDRINPFYDIDFLDFATIGKLATAPTEEECNFHVKDFFKDNKDKAKYVNHKAIITICLGLIIFGLMIITGSIYKIVIGLIGLVGDLLNIE